MSARRYELNAIFHSGKAEDDIIAELFTVLGTSAAMTLKEVLDEVPDAVGGWADLTQPILYPGSPFGKGKPKQ